MSSRTSVTQAIRAVAEPAEPVRLSELSTLVIGQKLTPDVALATLRLIIDERVAEPFRTRVLKSIDDYYATACRRLSPRSAFLTLSIGAREHAHLADKSGREDLASFAKLLEVAARK